MAADDHRPAAAPERALVAAETGYADQAHLVREFHRFIRTTRTRFLARPLRRTPRAGGGEFRSRRRHRRRLACPRTDLDAALAVPPS